jgi:hypothetical protein
MAYAKKKPIPGVHLMMGPRASEPVVRLNKYATKTRLNKENLWGHKKKKFGYYKDTSNALMQFGRD